MGTTMRNSLTYENATPDRWNTVSHPNDGSTLGNNANNDADRGE